MPSPARNAASASAKNTSRKRSKNCCVPVSPSTRSSAARCRVSVAGNPVMKFSMFIQPPSPTPRSVTGRPDRLTSCRPLTFGHTSSSVMSPDAGPPARLLSRAPSSYNRGRPLMPTSTRFVIVFVVDGLRPDAINAEDTPTLHRLRAEGVAFTNSHAVFPTVTRVNAATLATGAQPGTNGIVGNQMYVPAVDRGRAFGTDDFRSLRALDAVTGGHVVLVPTLAERLQARGLRLAGVGSGSTGSTFLLDPRATDGVGVLVNGYFEPGKVVAYPEDVSGEILARFGPAPPKGGLTDRYDAVVTWTQRVLREYVLPELSLTVVLNWLTEPDHTQHGVGVGSPSAREALRHGDREIAQTLRTLDTLGLTTSTAVFVVSDHGFTTNAGSVDVAAELVAAGLKAAPDSANVVLASSGQAVALHVAERDADRIARLVSFVQSRE